MHAQKDFSVSIFVSQTRWLCGCSYSLMFLMADSKLFLNLHPSIPADRRSRHEQELHAVGCAALSRLYLSSRSFLDLGFGSLGLEAGGLVFEVFGFWSLHLALGWGLYWRFGNWGLGMCAMHYDQDFMTSFIDKT